MTQAFIDTNFFLRYIIKDNEEHYNEVKSIFNSGINRQIKLFTSTVVIFETYYVLKSFYEVTKEDCIKALSMLISFDFIEIENREIIFKSLQIFAANNISLEDSYNLAYSRSNNATEFMTFDKKLKKLFR